LPTLGPVGADSTGSLTVNIGPNSLAGEGWRFIGETDWRTPGSTASGLLPDTYFIEFAQVSGYSKPPSQAVQVSGGATLTVQANYVSAAVVSSSLLPVQVI